MEKFYNNLSIEEKRKLRKLLENHEILRKKQIVLMEKLIEPLRVDLENVKKVKKGSISIKQFVRHTNIVNKYLKKLGR